MTFSGGTVMTFPTDGYIEINIEENLTTPGGARLVSLGEIKDHLNIPAADRTRDAKLLRMLAGFVTPYGAARVLGAIQSSFSMRLLKAATMLLTISRMWALFSAGKYLSTYMWPTGSSSAALVAARPRFQRSDCCGVPDMAVP